jgi:putative spermidine/putrescine transport system ATP-binding protein
MIAGFVRPDAGDIEIGGEIVTHLPPERRGLGIVFQNYAIFPHMHVYDNIAFGLRMRKVSKEVIGRRVGAALAQVGLAGYEARYQRQLSGGEQQRELRRPFPE